MASDELLSMQLSKLLDNLGYSPAMIQYRRAAYREYDEYLNLIQADIPITTVGSKGEGITKRFESDNDVLFIPTSVLCLEQGLNREADHVQNNISVFTMDTSYCYPGYAILTSRIAWLVPASIAASLTPSGEGQYVLSSDLFLKYHTANSRPFSWLYSVGGISAYTRTGPALSSSIGMSEFDRVFSLRCFCPSILYDWFRRPRQYDWPPLELSRTILASEANLVAQGFKESEMKHLEWRICFNKIELLLIKSLNETHIKLYILLKMILKDILQPQQKELTSYIMKNIVFWLAEMYPVSTFQEKNLLKFVSKALRLLKKVVKARKLPYYMIPGRNLLVEKMNQPLRKRLLKRLNCLLEEGPCLLLRVRRLTVTTRMSYTELGDFCTKRDELEILFLKQVTYQLSVNIQGQSLHEFMNDMSHGDLTSRLLACIVHVINDGSINRIARMGALVISDWPQHIKEKLRSCPNGPRILMDQLAMILS